MRLEPWNVGGGSCAFSYKGLRVGRQLRGSRGCVQTLRRVSQPARSWCLRLGCPCLAEQKAERVCEAEPGCLSAGSEGTRCSGAEGAFLCKALRSDGAWQRPGVRSSVARAAARPAGAGTGAGPSAGAIPH